MGLFTVGLRDDDFEPAYKFPALPHRVRGRCLVAFAGVHLAVHVVRDLVHIDADTTNHGVYAADDAVVFADVLPIDWIIDVVEQEPPRTMTLTTW